MLEPNTPTSIVLAQIRIALSTLGMSEKYHSFNYLTDIIYYMIKVNDDSTKTYHTALSMLAEKYDLTERSIIGGLQKLLKLCNRKVKLKTQFNLIKNSTLNKIRVLKTYILNNAMQ